jgi:hypothetical protein
MLLLALKLAKNSYCKYDIKPVNKSPLAHFCARGFIQINKCDVPLVVQRRIGMPKCKHLYSIICIENNMPIVWMLPIQKIDLNYNQFEPFGHSPMDGHRSTIMSIQEPFQNFFDQKKEHVASSTE